jgi:hypothetical protein
MNLLEKIQKLPLIQKKIILWTIMVIVAIFLFFIWTKILNKNLQNLKKTDFSNQFKIPDLKEKLEKDLPKIEIPSNLQNFNQDSLMGK